ncbi:unnamed protein product [Blepharisma stoltei]|uniref:Receptor ligand binding region domain-containing protein n=1 Tax=Blepharisma stoltei TaxID=1481888 RepID=A0AAU9I6H2_9CILI|nr:unnamed protein product [Blepharisma stoltei]
MSYWIGLLKALVLSIIFVEGQLIVDIIYSPYTEQGFASSLKVMLEKSFQNEFEFNLVYLVDFWDIDLAINSPDIVFDLTFSASLLESIKKLAEVQHFIIGSIAKPAVLYSNWEFFMHNSWENQIKTLYSIISYLNWQTFIVISDETYSENNEFYDYFFDKDYRWFYFSNTNDERSADLFTGRAIQPIGVKNIVILNKGESTKLLLKSLEKLDLFGFGTGVIVGSEGSWGLYGNGVVSYTESGLETADSNISYESLAIINFLKLVLSFSQTSDNSDLLDFLMKNTIDRHPISKFSLLNIQNNLKVISGSIANNTLYIMSPLKYPGNSLAIPNSPTTPINIWYDNSSWSLSALDTLTIGEFYALDYYKTLHSLDGFKITTTPCNCGMIIYDQASGFSCFAKLVTIPAVGFLTSFAPWTSILYIYALRSLKCSIPNVSPYATSSLTQNKATFPEFMTVIKDERFNSQVILDLAVIFGWKNVIVLYDDNNKNTYLYFIALAEKLNIKIANRPELQKIDNNYTRDKYPVWKDWFAEIISLKLRLFVIFLSPPYALYIFESFYDAGLRQGDIIFLSNNRIAYGLSLETDNEQRRKLLELSYGGIAIAQTEWIGEYGETVKNGFVKKYGNQTDFGCWAFDAAMLLLNGIEFTIKQGENVKNYEVLNNNLRKQKFIGCSGTVSIESGGNQRSFPTLGIYSLRWDERIQSIYEELVGQYDINSAQLITLYKSILWYDNTTVIPTDTIVYENGCPFPKSKIINSNSGAKILYGISAAVVIFTIITAFAVWKKFWKNITIKQLSIAAHIHFEDYILMGIIAADFFQFISQGPDISDLYMWLSKACSYSLIHFDSSVTGDIYWIYLYSAMIIACFWIFSAFILIFKLKICDSWMLRYARKISLLLLPIIGNLLFVPMISVLLSIFQCDKGIGSSITDSFIKNDCTTYCWTQKYSIWGALSIIFLATYIPLTIYFREYYENVNDHINIKTNPLLIIEKSIFQVIIVSMSKTIKIYSESLHGLCCIMLILILIVISLKQNSYNYSRMNLWLIISYLAILWNFILSSLYWLTKFDSLLLWRMMQYSLWLILLIAGIIIQCKWLPSLLITDKGADITIFFKFLMGSQVSAADINKIRKEVARNNFSNSQTPNSSSRLNIQF